MKFKLTTTAACRVARIDRDRFNEAVSADEYPCAPRTTPGRARLFDQYDMIALWLYREFTDEGVSKKRAGAMACKIAAAARANPDARAISLVQTYVGTEDAFPADAVPASTDWDSVYFSGSDIKSVMTYRVGKLREMIARDTEEERNIIGPDD